MRILLRGRFAVLKRKCGWHRGPNPEIALLQLWKKFTPSRVATNPAPTMTHIPMADHEQPVSQGKMERRIV